jgi:secreted Zn-dependent insulinase-like peptidase
MNEPGLEVWHLHDTSFEVPRAVILLRVLLGSARDDESRALAELNAALLTDALQLWGYPVKTAGLAYRWSSDGPMLELMVAGYDDKQAEVLTELLERVKSADVDPKRFDIIRAKMARDWRNRSFARPYEQVMRAYELIVDPERLSKIEAAAMLDRLTVADLERWREAAFGRVWVQMFVHGNHSAEDATQLGELVHEQLVVGRAGDKGKVARRSLTKQRLTVQIDVDHEDSAIYIVRAAEQDDLAEHARHLLVAALVKGPFFTELRTKQQLGYVVAARACTTDRRPGLCFLIQSPTTDPVSLESKIGDFLVAQRKVVEAMTEPDLATVRAGVAAKLREQPSTLFQRSEKLYSLLVDRRPWDHREQLAKQVEAIDLPAALKAYDELLLSKDRGQLIIRSVGKKHRVSKPADCRDAKCAIAKLQALHERPR